MSTVIKIYDHRNNRTLDVSNLAFDISIETQLEEQPTKCTFKLLRAPDLKFYEGATVSMKFDGFKVFKGYVFVRKYTQNADEMQVTAYDLLRYLKYEDTYVYSGKTSDQLFKQICKDYNLKYKIVDKSSFVCPARSEDNTTLYEIIQTALDQTLINTQKRFIIRDNFGTLEHINVMSLDTKLFIGDKSGVTKFDYEISIDKDVYNQVKLYRDNEDTGKRDVWIINDTATKGKNKGRNLKEWGILQVTKEVDENYTSAQIKDLAEKMFKYYNQKRRKIKITSLGDFNVRAGSIIYCKFSGYENLGKVRRFLVNSCTHTIDNGKHTMQLELEAVSSGWS